MDFLYYTFISSPNSHEEFFCFIFMDLSQEFCAFLWQQYPVMLTSINDRCMTHLTCGGEFNIAMDTEFLIWVWGKNDAGQVSVSQ